MIREPRLTTAPTVEPVTVDQLRMHSRISFADEDSVLAAYIKAAREMVETDLMRALCTQTWTLKLDQFPCDLIELRRCPAVSVTSITYTDTAGASQTLAADQYVVDTNSEPGRITPAYGASWPSTYAQANVVTVVFTAGYGGQADVPERAKQAIRMLAAHWAINREAIGSVGDNVPLGYDSLIDRLRWGGYR